MRTFLVAPIAALASLSLLNACGRGESAGTASKSSIASQTSATSALPANYDSLSASQKSEELWARIENSEYKELPAWSGFDVFGFVRASMAVTMDRVSDEMPQGRKKFIHPLGSVAKVKFVGDETSPFTGLYKGSEFGLVRLSLAADPKAVGFTPGLALKALVDGAPSENLIAMYSLDGQGTNKNFFANEFSNIVTEPKNPALKVLKLVFDRASKHALHLDLEHFSKVTEKGYTVPNFAPYQIFFVPTAEAQLPADSSRDFREDLGSLPAGTRLYEVYGTVREGKPERFHIGSVITTSRFVSSKFGDESLFFRHRRFNNE